MGEDEVDYVKIKGETLSEIFSLDVDDSKNFEDVEYIEDIYEAVSDKVKIKTMFIAESPKNKNTYFYNLEERSKFRCGILCPLIGTGYKRKIDEKIKDFIIKKGYWLTDLFYKPLNEIEEEDIDREVKKNKECLLKEINKLEPERIVFTLLKGAFDNSSNGKYEKMKEYFKVVKEKEADEFISTQEEILSNLKDELNTSFRFKVAPFPYATSRGTIPYEWYEYEEGYCSFSDWVNKNNDWLEIEEDK